MNSSQLPHLQVKTHKVIVHICLSWPALDTRGWSWVAWFPPVRLHCFINCKLHSCSMLLSPTFRAVHSWFSLVKLLFPVWAFELKWLFYGCIEPLSWVACFHVHGASCSGEVRQWAESQPDGRDSVLLNNVISESEWCLKWASGNLIFDLCDASCVLF